jgi:hypothetical protein
MKNQYEILMLKKLNNSELIEEAIRAKKAETNMTLWVLHVLREIELKRAFADGSYPSLFEFCVEHLGYDRSAAYRRISAMRALKDLPELEEKIETGSLSMMNLVRAQTHFAAKKRENKPMAKAEKLKLVQELENKSTREAISLK